VETINVFQYSKYLEGPQEILIVSCPKTCETPDSRDVAAGRALEAASSLRCDTSHFVRESERAEEMAAKYKLAKEAFVSNLVGGTILEINEVTLTAPVRMPPLHRVHISC